MFNPMILRGQLRFYSNNQNLMKCGWGFSSEKNGSKEEAVRTITQLAWEEAAGIEKYPTTDTKMAAASGAFIHHALFWIGSVMVGWSLPCVQDNKN